jgi:hypothetical protein
VDSKGASYSRVAALVGFALLAGATSFFGFLGVPFSNFGLRSNDFLINVFWTGLTVTPLAAFIALLADWRKTSGLASLIVAALWIVDSWWVVNSGPVVFVFVLPWALIGTMTLLLPAKSHSPNGA